MPAGAGARVQTASIAVVATVTVMLFALGVVAVSTGRGTEPATLRLATATSAAPQAGTGPAVVAPGKQPTAGRTADAPNRQGSDGGRAGQQPPASAADAGTGAPPATTPTSRPLHATGGRPPVPDEGVEHEVTLSPARPGMWFGQVRMTQRDAFGEPNEDDHDAWVHAHAPADATQHLEQSPPLQRFAEEIAVYDETGRRIRDLHVLTPTGEAVFRSDEGFLEVPRTFRIGDSWTWSGQTDDGATRLEATLRIVGRGPVALKNGEEVDAVEYELDAAISGAHTLDVSRRVAFAPELGVAVTIDEKARGTTLDGRVVDYAAVFQLVNAEPESEPVVGVD